MAAIGREPGLTRSAERRLILQGVSTSRALMSRQDKIWSRYSRVRLGRQTDIPPRRLGRTS